MAVPTTWIPINSAGWRGLVAVVSLSLTSDTAPPSGFRVIECGARMSINFVGSESAVICGGKPQVGKSVDSVTDPL